MKKIHEMGNSETPLMKQYASIKAEYPEHILFFRLGDFYEMFDQDAVTASKILNITLTTRDKKKEDAVPLCGVPYHSANTYIKRLLQNGFRVAICEQIEDPKISKGIVKRDVVRLVTPGTVFETDLLNEKEHNFLAGIYLEENGMGISFLDLTTGEFRTTQHTGKDYLARLRGEISRMDPKEIVIPRDYKTDKNIATILDSFSIQLSRIDIDSLGFEEAAERLKSFYGIPQAEGMGLNDKPFACIASAYLIEYLKMSQKRPLFHIKPPHLYGLGDIMILDHTTLMNLELVRSMDPGTKGGTLLEIIDQTSTPMGARCLKDWVLHPLIDCDSIQKRLDAVEELLCNQDTRSRISGLLTGIFDLERICGRISLGIVSSQNMLALKSSIPLIQEIRKEASAFESPLLKEENERCHPLQEVYDLINNTLADDNPYSQQKTGLIKRNVNEELDRLYDISRNGKEWISRLEAKERKRTGITSLKIGYNKIFGYYIEVTKANLPYVPNEYIRKQTIVNGERYITEELKKLEYEILGAEEKIMGLEKEIFGQLVNALITYLSLIQETAQSLSNLDCLVSLAEVAAKHNYTKPQIDLSLELDIKQGRHPVLEAAEKERPFVPNDIFMDCKGQQLIILTGPNMAGKSTYMRQVALIVLMAQIGSFVPAKKAKIGLVDRIFTRVGASDRLYKGQSTFLVEMIETASILHQATHRSLIILDEIGRGTSTYDGISIAWAVAEYIHDDEKLGARTLFATHYHELTELSNCLERARNFTIDVHEENGKVIFLYNVIEGGSDKSYGVHVAELAGLPRNVIENAYSILNEMEYRRGVEITQIKSIHKYKFASKPKQLALFSDPKANIIRDIKDLDPTRLSPLMALKKINSWKKNLT
ncbi:DNA mismatch repair protein MutS [bacterium]|nr:DNA mismatch repair protein MutS [bacterium]